MSDNGSPNPELALVELPDAHPCGNCGQCCTYIAVEIDNPSSFDDYDHIYWYLTHRSICVYVDWEGDWFVEMETVCEHLTEARTCGIYDERPKMCSDFSWKECEKTTKEEAWKYRFDAPQELLEFMRDKRPRNYERYMKAKQKLIAKRQAADAPAPSETETKAHAELSPPS